jgi:hypothetical protein
MAQPVAMLMQCKRSEELLATWPFQPHWVANGALILLKNVRHEIAGSAHRFPERLPPTRLHCEIRAGAEIGFPADDFLLFADHPLTGFVCGVPSRSVTSTVGHAIIPEIRPALLRFRPDSHPLSEECYEKDSRVGRSCRRSISVLNRVFHRGRASSFSHFP